MRVKGLHEKLFSALACSATAHSIDRDPRSASPTDFARGVLDPDVRRDARNTRPLAHAPVRDWASRAEFSAQDATASARASQASAKLVTDSGGLARSAADS